MKILNILTSTMIYDGITMSVLNFLKNINDKNIKMDFVSSFIIKEIEEQIKEKNGNVFLLKDRKKRPIKYINELSKIIKQNKYDIVQAHGSSAMLSLEMIAAKKAGCKIRIAHSRNTKTQHVILDKLLRPVFYKTYTHGFACGEEAGKWLFGNRPFTVINNGKDIEKFRYNEKIRMEVRKKYDLDNKIVIGHVGNFNYQKNHEYLIDIFYELVKGSNNKDYYLILIGGGTFQNIKEKAKKLGIDKNILFVGRSSEVEKWLQAMDIMVFPSRYEGFPNVLIEWQIAGLPSIVSDKITNKVKLTELVQFASIEDSPDKWVELIKSVSLENRKEDQEEILSLIKEKGFDIKENAKQLKNMYYTLLEESKK